MCSCGNDEGGERGEGEGGRGGGECGEGRWAAVESDGGGKEGRGEFGPNGGEETLVNEESLGGVAGRGVGELQRISF